MWFAKAIKVVRKDGSTRERELWLCPDCAHEVGSARKCVAFLRASVKE